MDKINLLALDNDASNIIGDYIKNDNIDRTKKEEQKFKQDIFEFVDRYMKRARRETKLSRDETRVTIWLAFHETYTFCFGPNYDDKKFLEVTKFYNEYLKLKKLNLKK